MRRELRGVSHECDIPLLTLYDNFPGLTAVDLSFVSASESLNSVGEDTGEGDGES